MADQSNIQSAASKSIRPFRSSEEYLYAMKEDLAEWLHTLYDLDITADTFMDALETGCALCRHANNVNRAAQDFQRDFPEAARSLRVPAKDVVFQSRGVAGGSFVARDNVSNFISWCRQELRVKDVLMFETNDLVEKCNEKNFVLCLLEVARRGAKFGMLAPMLIQLEEEIEEEIRDQGSQGLRGEDGEEEEEEEAGEEDAGDGGGLGGPGGPGSPVQTSPPGRRFGRKDRVRSVEEDPDPEQFTWQPKRVLCDMRNLDELVREILGRCSCPAQFPMIKVSEGKYKVGDSSALIFIRVLRTHVMVRVGGGWDTLEHYLDKHDPCRCAAFAHRYHQSKSSSQGQGGQSKSSSAHSSRSTSPGPHWRNEGIAPYKPPDRRSLEPPAAPCSSSPSSSRPGRSQNPPTSADPDPNAARTLLPRPPRDRSEPRHFKPLRNKEAMMPLTRRLSGDSDSSTASSKGGGGGGGGGRFSLGGGGASRRGEEVVLLVNRKEGKHMIERGRANQSPTLRPSMPPRARSQSRERSALAAMLKPNPPQGSPDAARSGRTERGRSLGMDGGGRRLHAPRSHSQSKLQGRSRPADASPGPAPFHRDAPPPDRREDLRARQPPLSSSPRSGGFTKRPSPSSCSGSPCKGVQNNCSSPGKKNAAAPRPPAPRSPSVGKGRLLPPVTAAAGGRRSPHSSPHHRGPSHHHHHAARSPRTQHGARPAGRGHHRTWTGVDRQEPEEEEEEEEDEGGGVAYECFQMLPAIDPQREQELYRSFEAEILANTKQARGSGRTPGGGGGSSQGPGTLPTPAPADPNVTDSAYSSSNSSTSSLNVGAKAGTLPDLRESKRTNPRHFPLEDPLNLVYGGPHGEPEHWGERVGGLRKLPAISSSTEDAESDRLVNRVPNGDHGAQRGHSDWGPEGDRQPDSYELENSGGDSCPSPVPPRPPSEDCSYQDSSSENSSMCFSLSESRSESSPPPSSPVANGNADGELPPPPRTKKAGKSGGVSKHKPKPRIRPRIDNRPENSPSRIPTPVSYRDLRAQDGVSPCCTPPLSPQTSRSGGRPATCKSLHQAFTDMINPQTRTPAMGSKDCSYPGPTGTLDSEAWM